MSTFYHNPGKENSKFKTQNENSKFKIKKAQSPKLKTTA